jgi:AraC-like DNA-binding protein
MHWSGTVASGEGWFAFRGDTADNTPHGHAAVQLAIAGPTPVAITYDGGRVEGDALLVRSGVRHALEPARGILLILFEPDAPEAAFLSDKAPQGGVVALPASLASLVDPLAGCERCLDRLTEAAAAWPKRAVDPRLQVALEILRATNGPRPIGHAASASGLSPARLRALATRDLGRPLAEWLAWRRSERAVASMRNGASLAAAAADAGFADQAHMAKAIRRLLGITPGTVDGVLHHRAGQAKTTIRKLGNEV